MAAARALGVTDAEVDALAGRVVDALAGGALGPDDIRAAVARPPARSARRARRRAWAPRCRSR
jgi:hypothetical protein